MSDKEEIKKHEASGLLEPFRFDLLFSQDKIARKVHQMGRQISFDYKGKFPILIGVLKGCITFMADLIREISVPIEIEFINATSYANGQEQSDYIVFEGGPENPIKGRHVLIVEGVVDSGRTVVSLTKRLLSQEPESIEIVTLLDKPNGRLADIDIKYKGFVIGDDFVIGYGLDESQKYRNLPFIGKVLDN